MYQIKFSIKDVVAGGRFCGKQCNAYDGKSRRNKRLNNSRNFGKSIYSRKKLGNKAHEDKNFRELFFGSLKFLSATPAISGKRSFILPQSLQR